MFSPKCCSQSWSINMFASFISIKYYIYIYIYYQEVVWAGGEDELVRLDGPVLTGQGDVRQALRLVQGVEHLEHYIQQFGNIRSWYT